MRMTRVIEPGLVTQTDRVDHECVALVPADRVAHPGRVRALGVFLIHRDGPPNACELIEDVHNLGSLNHRKFPWIHPNSGYTRRVAVPLNRIINVRESLFGAEWRPRVLPFSRCPRRHRSQLRFSAEWVGGIPSIYSYTVGSGGPETGQIRRVSGRLGLFGICGSLLRSGLC